VDLHGARLRGARLRGVRLLVVTELHTRQVSRAENLPPVQLGNDRPAVVRSGSGSVAAISAPVDSARPVSRALTATAAITVLVTVLTAGCGAAPVLPQTAAQVVTQPAGARPVAQPPAGCGSTAWGCEQQRRFDAVSAYVARLDGGHASLSAVFADRVTGQTWRAGPTAQPGWTASTIKLAIATDLLERARAGAVTLTVGDHRDLAAMLNNSDEPASDRLWAKFGDDTMLARFRDRFGMSGVRFVPGFSKRAYWGFVKCTSDDLATLMRHTLTVTDPADRGYLVSALRTVAPNQRWGVWSAGPDYQPGNKDGWSFETDGYGKHWVAATVGFAGPDQRYVVAVMYQLDPRGSLADGVHAVSDVVALLFGRPVPAPVEVPAPDG
jgi:hypothetical protein